MIEQSQIAAILVEACPSFQEEVAAHQEEYGGELTYVLLGSFAHHLLALHTAGKTESFPAVGSAIEKLHVEGSAYTKEAATIGLLEGIQNAWGHAGVNHQPLLAHLGPESARNWQSLNDFWSGKIPYVGYRG